MASQRFCVGKLALAAMSMVAGSIARDAAAATLHQVARLEGVQPAYVRLLDVLHHVRGRGSRPDRAKVAAAAGALQAAIKSDGNARDRLVVDARNIVVSLSDGSFSAPRSIEALRRDARGNVVEAGAWRPEATPGSRVAGTVGARMHQGGLGDCVGISVLKAFSTTAIGEEILRETVRTAADKSYNVTFAGDPGRTFKETAGSLGQLGKGDPAGAAVIAALFSYFGVDPRHGALPTNKAMELLAMGMGQHRRLWDATASPREIDDFLRRYAPRVGRDTAMVFGGKPGHGGVWSRGDGHAFAVLGIDQLAGTVTYTNPWDDTREHTIPIATLAQQAAGTGADFEIVTFDPGAMTREKSASAPRDDHS